MKKNKWIIWLGIGVAAYYIWKQRQQKSAGKAVLLPILPSESTPSSPNAQDAANEAKKLVSEAIDKTTFLPDLRTFGDLYKEDQKYCK